MDRPNLARSPFQDSRPVWLVGSVLAATAVVLTAVSLAELVSVRSEEHALAGRLVELRERGRTLRTQVEAANRRLSTVSWKALSTETASLGGVVTRRQLSWTRLLRDLERVVPWDVRLVSVDPVVEQDGRINVRLQGMAVDRAAWLRLIARLFTDGSFSDPIPSSEESSTSSGMPGYRFQIQARYWPEGKP